MTTRKSNGRAMVKWDERLAALAQAAKKTVAQVGGGGNFLSIRGGALSYQKVAVKGNKMRCIVLAQVLENQHYPAAFDPDSPASPDCYAFGEDRDGMAPHEAVERPFNPTCAGCPMKEFGSAERGRGKACGDVIRLALIAEEDLGDIEGAEIAYLKVPYYSTLEWAAYVRELDEVYHKPPLAFFTELGVVPDPKSQFRVKFERGDELDEASFEALFARQEEAQRSIAFPYPKFEDAPAKAAPRGAAKPPAKRGQWGAAQRGPGKGAAPSKSAPGRRATPLPAPPAAPRRAADFAARGGRGDKF
jgi:hypothetical protein